MLSIGAINLLVPDYDQAIAYYVDKLGFELLEDTPMGPNKRWVVVSPSGAQGCALVLSQAHSETEKQTVGQQAAQKVLLFLHSDDFWRDYHRYQAEGVNFLEAPREEPYATVVVFQDIFGNRWDLLQKKRNSDV